MKDEHELYMRRCLQLAALGAGRVAPNPMVGAVLVHEGRIIGEGYHQAYGQAHAEVNCIASVQDGDLSLIPQSTLYVSLEPCAHHGKTPPCADLIVRHRIPRVVVGCRDPFPEVNGKGIEKLLAAGIEVVTDVCRQECRRLNRIFFTFYEQHRPYIVLKWAQSADGRIAQEGRPVRISNIHTDRLVHRWRSELASILVGTNTARIDDPSLTVRLWPGGHPVRLVLDKELSLPFSLRLFDGQVPTVVFNLRKNSWVAGMPVEGLLHYQMTEDAPVIGQIIHALCRMKLTSVLVEGGGRLLQSFIDEGCWDEARVITSSTLEVGLGLAAPQLSGHRLIASQTIDTDTLSSYLPQATNYS